MVGFLAGYFFMGSGGENWEAVTADQLEPGGFPVDEYDETSGHQYVLLDDDLIQQIGREISIYENLR